MKLTQGHITTVTSSDLLAATCVIPLRTGGDPVPGPLPPIEIVSNERFLTGVSGGGI